MPTGAKVMERALMLELSTHCTAHAVAQMENVWGADMSGWPNKIIEGTGETNLCTHLLSLKKAGRRGS